MSELRLKNTLTGRIQQLCVGFLIVCISITPLLSEVIVEGDVFGEWVFDESPYRVVGDITVTHEGLVIEPGVQVLFTGYYTFEVIGFLSAVGDDPEDQRITFGSDSVLWQGISFDQASQASELINCNINNAWIGVNCTESELRISECDIDAQHTGINCDGSSPEIIDNRRIRVSGSANDRSAYIAINLTNNSYPIILRNLIQCDVDVHTDAYGIYMRAYSGAVINSNQIETHSWARAHSIDVRQVSKLEITSNIIETYSPQSLIGISTEDATGVEIYQNTMVMTGSSYQGAVGIKVGSDSRLSIINNIIVGNHSSIGVWNQDGQILDGSNYNDFFQHDENLVGDWQDFDFLENLLDVDPLFIEDEDAPYKLRGDTTDWPNNWEDRSPCIDFGNPDWTDPDESRSDIGRWYVHHPEIIVSVPDEVPALKDYELVKVYPNPFNEGTRLTFRTEAAVPVLISVYNVQGRLIQDVFNNTLPRGKHDISLTLGNQTPGMYILRLDRPSGTVSRKIIYLP